jgi:hypothetical protein
MTRYEVLACVGYRQPRPSDDQLVALRIRLAAAGAVA